MKLLRSILLPLLLAASFTSTVLQVRAQEAPQEPRPNPLERIIPHLPHALDQFIGRAAVEFDNSGGPRSVIGGVALTTPSVFLQVPKSNYFLLSFWYNSTGSNYFSRVFRAEDPVGNTVAELAFVNGDLILQLQVNNANTPTVVSFSTIGVSRPPISSGTTGPIVQYDGNWHNVIVNAHMTGACLTNSTLPCCLQAEFTIDGGTVSSMMALDPNGNSSGSTYAVFGPFLWSSATSWTIAGAASIPAPGSASRVSAASFFYNGMLAEFYLQLDDGGMDPPTPLLTDTGRGAIVGNFINRSPRFAVGLGPGLQPHVCLGPTSRTPTMCHAGNPQFFTTGPGGSYQLHTLPLGGDIRFATSDPCGPLSVLDFTGCK